MTDNDRRTSLRRLVIRVSRLSLSFSTTDGNNVVYEPYQLKSSISIAANMREALHKVSLLSQPFGRVLVMVDSPVMMVPSDLFVEDEMESLYYHTFTRQDQQVVIHTVLPDLSSIAVFTMPKDLRTVITDAYPNVRILAAFTPLWRHLNQRNYTGSHSKLYAYFHEKSIDVFCFTQNRFKFCNSYGVDTAEDILYYVLAAWKQLGMSPEHDELYICGNIPERDKIRDNFDKFIKRVFVINPAGEFNRVSVAQIEGIPYDLITLYVKGL